MREDIYDWGDGPRLSFFGREKIRQSLKSKNTEGKKQMKRKIKNSVLELVEGDITEMETEKKS